MGHVVLANVQGTVARTGIISRDKIRRCEERREGGLGSIAIVAVSHIL